MRPAPLAAMLVVALSAATGLAALTGDRGVAHFPDMPARPHATLGPVAVLARPEEGARAVLLAEAARDRFGPIDALAQVRTQALPWSDVALLTGVAIRWE